MRLPEGIFNTSYAKDTAIIRTRWQWFLFVLLLILLFTLPPLFGNRHQLQLANIIGISIIAVLGLNVLTGCAGQISLGQAAFTAVGGYTAAAFAVKLDLPFWLAIPAAAIVAGLVGLIFALPAARIKGFYLAMSTLAAHFIILWVVKIIPDITDGINGMRVPPPELGGFSFDTPQRLYFLIIPIVIIMAFLARNFVRTKVGRAMIAVRDNDLAAEVMGVNTFKYKVLAFTICSAYAGVAGALLAYNHKFVHPDSYPLMDAIWYLGMLIVGGMGSVSGAILGTIFIRVLNDLTATELVPFISDTWPSMSAEVAASMGPLTFGLILMLFLIFEPRGIIHRWELFKASYRLWPFAHAPGGR
ncbi:MAG: branched-chain amino acid ABC transporter permease [Chloroflexi bacterium]|nr:branched-chain amino acid ABC transporter permease [Chloroflexota bacterium]